MKSLFNLPNKFESFEMPNGVTYNIQNTEWGWYIEGEDGYMTEGYYGTKSEAKDDLRQISKNIKIEMNH